MSMVCFAVEVCDVCVSVEVTAKGRNRAKHCHELVTRSKQIYVGNVLFVSL